VSRRDLLLAAGIGTLLACTVGLLMGTGGHWLAWIDGQLVGVGLIVASSLGD
jgi:hypothetical protein